MIKTPRILTLDIETAPLEAYIWELGQQYITLDKVKQDWTILSYCGKWLNEKGTIIDYTGGRGAGRVRDDRKLLSGIWRLLNESDIVIAQNGARFDLPKINARLLINGYGPYSPIRVIDTCKVARRVFGFTSNKLAYLSEKLTDTPKSEHKKFPGLELWIECLKDNPEAWTEMLKYNEIDVLATEKVYLTQRAWMENHLNLAVYAGQEERVCPKCQSTKLQRRGYARSNAGVYPRYHCKSCGGWSRGRFTEMPAEARKELLI